MRGSPSDLTSPPDAVSLARQNPNAATMAARDIKIAIRFALEDTFVYWRKNIAPKHFSQEAFSRYPFEYANSFKNPKNSGGRKVRTDSPDPLVETGETKAQILNGTVLFQRSKPTALKVTFPNVPQYFYMYHATAKTNTFARRATMDKTMAVEAISDTDAQMLRDYYTGRLNHYLADAERRQGAISGGVASQLEGEADYV